LLLGISGKAGVGKDVFATIAKEEFGAVIIPFAAGVKEEVADFLTKYAISFQHRNLWGSQADKEESVEFGWCVGVVIEEHPWLAGMGRDLTFRGLLQGWGTEFRRTEDTDYWVKKTLAKVTDPKTLYVISDVRFPNETAAILNAGGSLIRVYRPLGVNISNMEHVSETALDGWREWNYEICNGGTLEEYMEQCRDVLRIMEV
jgi:hypothetical protein